MVITLLDLYNNVANQPWSMFDEVDVEDDFNKTLLSSINKAVVEVWNSYNFDFRKQTDNIYTQPNLKKYDLPNGIIVQKEINDEIIYNVKLGRQRMSYLEDFNSLENGIPKYFYVDEKYIYFTPVPNDVYKIKIEYYTYSIGYSADNIPIYFLQNATDYIDIPTKFEQLFLDVIIAKAMMNSLVDVSDENYLGYKNQYDKSLKILKKALGCRKKNKKINF